MHKSSSKSTWTPIFRLGRSRLICKQSEAGRRANIKRLIAGWRTRCNSSWCYITQEREECTTIEWKDWAIVVSRMSECCTGIHKKKDSPTKLTFWELAQPEYGQRQHFEIDPEKPERLPAKLTMKEKILNGSSKVSPKSALTEKHRSPDFFETLFQICAAKRSLWRRRGCFDGCRTRPQVL